MLSSSPGSLWLVARPAGAARLAHSTQVSHLTQVS